MCTETFIRISRLVGTGRILRRSGQSNPQSRMQRPAPALPPTMRFIPAAPSRRTMERDMRIFRSKRVCLSCNRSLPRAASRCPWCIDSIVVPAALLDRPIPHRDPRGRNMAPRLS